MTTTDAQVQAAKLAYHRAAADVHLAKAHKIEADMKAAQDLRDLALRRSLKAT